jgi:uncharacterized membrane protein
VDVGTVHVGAASVALVLGLVLIARRKGDAWHVRLGRLYVAAMLLVAVPVLFVFDITGGPGVFHALAVVSLLTTTLGWSAVRGQGRHRAGVAPHATFMAWSWVGVVTAGLAQLANHRWPDESPWPVLAVVAMTTLAGALAVPPSVSRALLVSSSGRSRRSGT